MDKNLTPYCRNVPAFRGTKLLGTFFGPFILNILRIFFKVCIFLGVLEA